ncbi:hypothetical protein [uncultured Deinococcus sp.]|uniref:hypothetical protein n=1 Tax=uncultured Deinococcus sp. TaxID=158789 RepID=UPI0025F0E9B3|nr:hypothetical protein [uncultured Deinococcus sp.]
MNEMKAALYAHSIPAIQDDFYTLSVLIDRALTSDDIARVSGCIGYALRQTLAGEDLSDPVTVILRGASTLITYWYDSTKSRRDDPDHEGALRLAARYIVEGSPIRTTNRAGAGTQGTRLVSGIGPCTVTFDVDIDPHDPRDPEPTPAALGAPDALAQLNAARARLQAAQDAYIHAAAQYAGSRA